jgi:hypothetical protein
MPNFSSILDKQASDIERPKPLPIGTYSCQVKGLPRFDKSSKKQTEFVEFTLSPFGVLDDVDPEALEEMGGFNGKTIKATFYITEDAAWRLKDFLVACGIDAEGKSLNEMINEAPGQSVNVYLVHEPAQDGSDAIFARPRKFIPYGEE